MNRHTAKFQQKEQQVQGRQQQGQTEQTRDYASVEELLRSDAAQVQPPASVAERLNRSLAQEPKPEPVSWWRRLLGERGS